MRIRAERAAEGQAVRSRLLLTDSPRSLSQISDQFRPLDSTLDLDDAVHLVEGENAIHTANVDERRIRRELLSTHRVASTGDADRRAVSPADRLLRLAR